MTNDIVKGSIERLTHHLTSVKEKWVRKGHWDSMSTVERKNALRAGIAYELGNEIIDLKGGDIAATSAAIKNNLDDYIDTII